MAVNKILLFPYFLVSSSKAVSSFVTSQHVRYCFANNVFTIWEYQVEEYLPTKSSMNSLDPDPFAVA